MFILFQECISCIVGVTVYYFTEKMKIPTNNGFYGHDSSAYIPDGSDIGNGADNEAPTQDGDFSEYMWMENEEEFDKQVRQ